MSDFEIFMTIFYILIIGYNLFVNLNVIIEKLIMKYILILFVASVMLSACIEKEINPQDIVGKWTSTGLTQQLHRDGITWNVWTKNGRIDKSQFFEFRSDGTFNYAPRSSWDSCLYGDRYIKRVHESTIWIGYSGFKKPSKFDCGLIDIFPISNFIHSISGDTMVRGSVDNRTKFVRIK